MNSDEIDELVERLSDAGTGQAGTLQEELCWDAADALRQLQADNQRLVADNERLKAGAERLDVQFCDDQLVHLVTVWPDGERELMDLDYSFVSMPATATCNACNKRIDNPEAD